VHTGVQAKNLTLEVIRVNTAGCACCVEVLVCDQTPRLDINLDNNKNLFVVASILISGIGGLTIQIPYALAENGAVEKTIQVTAIATALIIGIVTNIILTKIENGKLGKSGEQDVSEE
jgi:xanthine/uracil permease